MIIIGSPVSFQKNEKDKLSDGEQLDSRGRRCRQALHTGRRTRMRSATTKTNAIMVDSRDPSQEKI